MRFRLIDALDGDTAAWVVRSGTPPSDDLAVDRLLQRADAPVVRQAPVVCGPLTAGQALDRLVLECEDVSSLSVEERRLVGLLRRETGRASRALHVSTPSEDDRELAWMAADREARWLG